MSPLIIFVINLIFIDIVWKSVEMIIDGHVTTRTTDFIISILWALTLTFLRKD